MAKVYIRGTHITPYDTRSLTASANSFITNATVAVSSGGGGLATVDDIDIEFYNNIMLVTCIEL